MSPCSLGLCLAARTQLALTFEVKFVMSEQLVTLQTELVMAEELGFTILSTMMAMTPPATRKSRKPMHLRAQRWRRSEAG